jgi:hypothetical protein
MRKKYGISKSSSVNSEAETNNNEIDSLRRENQELRMLNQDTHRRLLEEVREHARWKTRYEILQVEIRAGLHKPSGFYNTPAPEGKPSEPPRLSPELPKPPSRGGLTPEELLEYRTLLLWYALHVHLYSSKRPETIFWIPVYM